MSRLVVDQLQGNSATGNKITIPSGHQLIAPGAVLQVVNYPFTTYVSTTSTSFVNVWNGTITPKSANSKILIILSLCGMTSSGTSDYGIVRVTRNASQLYIADGLLAYAAGQSFNRSATSTTFYMDSAATTSLITYGVDYKCSISNIRINDYGVAGAVSSLTLMEIGG